MRNQLHHCRATPRASTLDKPQCHAYLSHHVTDGSGFPSRRTTSDTPTAVNAIPANIGAVNDSLKSNHAINAVLGGTR
jgi:hypothetical protein